MCDRQYFERLAKGGEDGAGEGVNREKGKGERGEGEHGGKAK